MVTLLTEDDMQSSFAVLSRSFGHDAPFIDIYFPAHDTSLGQEQGSRRLSAWKASSNVNSTFLKATLRPKHADEEILIGIAVWTLMNEPPPADLASVEDVTDVWPDEQDREFMTRLWKDYVVPRTIAIENSGDKGVYGVLDELPYSHIVHEPDL